MASSGRRRQRRHRNAVSLQTSAAGERQQPHAALNGVVAARCARSGRAFAGLIDNGQPTARASQRRGAHGIEAIRPAGIGHMTSIIEA